MCSTHILRGGIICVGAKLSAVELMHVGLTGIPVVALSMATGLAFIPWVADKAGLTPKLGSLLAIGTSVCGVTAITAGASVIKSDPKETSVAVANVVAFGTLGMLCYPYMAHTVFASPEQAGLFLGVAVHDTSQVFGAAATYNNLYGEEQVISRLFFTLVFDSL